ncbi:MULTISPECIES: hypothetical protein [Rheinheimera]|uniref:KfrA N-terminal DNA-binding domain-containing protein n=1 Tax=Rheinheimera marina TaxID=1774958 RepID=A0ABV9JRJ3_9GAMM
MSQLAQQVAAAAYALQQEGKEPSLALIKGRLGQVAMSPALLQAYQAWRNGQVPTEPLAPAVTAATPPTEQDDLRQQLNRIEAKLDRLLQKLDL